MRVSMISSVLGLAALVAAPLLGGCGSGYSDHRSSRNDDRYRDVSREDRVRMAGDRNTRISDVQDDGVRNGSARSFEERKASRAADQGDNDPARREAELRRDRELGR